eukprot:9318190-Pyramimonas_sp.AAC.1
MSLLYGMTASAEATRKRCRDNSLCAPHVAGCSSRADGHATSVANQREYETDVENMRSKRKCGAHSGLIPNAPRGTSRKPCAEATNLDIPQV